NLAVNARDAMPKGGTLTISTNPVEISDAYVATHPEARPGLFVCLRVSDAGCGMETAIMTRIFEPFFTTKEVGKGTGLGLATVYGVVKQSGGYIWVESKPQQGASFQIFLPRVAERAAETTVPTALAETIRGSETILLVEDSEALRKLTKSFLESHGFR